MSIVGENIYYTRKLKGITQIELVRMAGISHTTISAVENGSRDTKFSTVKKIAKAMDVSLPQLFSRVYDVKHANKWFEDDFIDIFIQNIVKDVPNAEMRLARLEMASVSSSSFSRIKHGAVDPYITSLIDISSITELDISQLFVRR